MDRTLLPYLQTWLTTVDRKPLVMRGARQVGKTWLVRQLAKISGKCLIEINFERNPKHASLFLSNDPRVILLNVSTLLNQVIEPSRSLLFLDEIQAAPDVLSKLRWFAEELPDLAVIAAGSLLEFVLTDHVFSMPVGRISYLHVEPFSFDEFLLANDKALLLHYCQQIDLSTPIPADIHATLTLLFKEYVLIGGMPAVLASWQKERSFSRVHQIQSDLLATYRDDLAKFNGRIALQKCDEVVMAIPKMLGQKFVFSRVSTEVQAATLKKILDLLQKARLCHRIVSCSANGVPLAAEINEKFFKEIFLDVGLCSTALGINLNQLNASAELNLINQGAIAEQVVGQLLRTLNPPYSEPALYYWYRNEKGANAEVDYLFQYANQIIPLEVKAGSTGSLKSLHMLMGLKNFSTAIRINSDYPSRVRVQTTDALGNRVDYQLLSLPFYLLSQIPRFIDSDFIQ